MEDTNFNRLLKSVGQAREMMIAENLIPFDMADYLDGDEAMAEYLFQVLADGDQDELLEAIGHITKARGMAQIAKDAGVGEQFIVYGHGSRDYTI